MSALRGEAELVKVKGSGLLTTLSGHKSAEVPHCSGLLLHVLL
jgi:hypothetical protein